MQPSRGRSGFTRMTTPSRLLRCTARHVRFDPQNFKAYLGRAGAYLRLQKPALAEEDYARAVQAAPLAVEPLFARGMERYFNKRFAEALRDFDAAIHLDPGRLELYHYRGCAAGELGQFDLALADFTQVIDHETENTGLVAIDLSNRAETQYHLGHFEAALADYQRAEAAGTFNPTAHGECLIKLKRYREAIAFYDKQLQPPSDDPQANNTRYATLYNRALARIGLKDSDGAESDLLAAIAAKPDDAPVYGNVAWALLLANRPAVARIAALQGLVLDDTAAWIRLNLAHAYLLEGRLDQARAIYVEEEDKPLDIKPALTRAQSVLEDFVALREAGVDSPAMASIEALLGKPPGEPTAKAVDQPAR